MRILVCERELLFREVLTLFLSGEGHQVEQCPGSLAEIGAAVSTGRPDVVLLDDGQAEEHERDRLLAGWRAADPRLRVLVLSADQPPSWAGSALGRSGLVDGALWRGQTLQEWERVISGRSAPGARTTLAGRTSPGVRAVPARRAASGGRGTAYVGPMPQPLTAREREIIECLAAGMSTHAMAGRLGVSQNTVHTHVQGVLRKFGVRSRLAAVSAYLRLPVAASAGQVEA